MHTQDATGLHALCDPSLPELLAWLQQAIGGVAVLAPGGRHHEYPMPVRRSFGQRAAAADRLIVGMGMRETTVAMKAP